MADAYFDVYNIDYMGLSYFDKVVHYQVCDFFYDEYKKGYDSKKISYQTFTSMCGVISKKIKVNAPLSKYERGIISRILDRLSSFFGFNDEQSIIYIYDFLVSEIWLKYYESVSAINSVFHQAKNI